MDLDGAHIMEQIRTKAADGARLPVIALTRRGDLKTKLAAFECGADDIVTIPFAPEESSWPEFSRSCAGRMATL
jgi:DNA-binding response OmpR family regulator